jgi:hypothetical protein
MLTLLFLGVLLALIVGRLLPLILTVPVAGWLFTHPGWLIALVVAAAAFELKTQLLNQPRC